MENSIDARSASQLVAVCEELSHARNMKMVMHVVRSAARRLTGADGATFVLLERDGKEDFCFYADEDAIGPLWKGNRFPVRSCISGWAMMQKSTVVIADVLKDERIPQDLYEPTFVRSLVMSPIRRNDPLGAIGTYWKEQRQPTKAEIWLLDALADITAVNIALVQLHETLESRIARRTAELETHNREQKANVEYAYRIQSALLPADWKMRELLPDHLVIYRPRDIVSGDFYWMCTRGEKLLFAVADCTGHGVTGALLAAICSHQLDRAVCEFGFTDPGLVLDMTRALVLERLAGGEDVRDGMDISLCCIDQREGTVTWSGANSDLYLLSGGELNVIKAHRQAIGRTDEGTSFPTHCLRFSKGDSLYMMTDGFVDQFGGEHGKKFLSRRLQELLLSVDHLPMQQRKEEIEATFLAWKGEHPQVDDVTLVGIRL